MSSGTGKATSQNEGMGKLIVSEKDNRNRGARSCGSSGSFGPPSRGAIAWSEGTALGSQRENYLKNFLFLLDIKTLHEQTSSHQSRWPSFLDRRSLAKNRSYACTLRRATEQDMAPPIERD